MKKKQIGILAGSFNPIHMGHLMIANYMKEFTFLDEVWLVVSPRNPLKKAENLLNNELRLKMARMAVEDYNGMKVSDIEFHMLLPSYTIDTMKKLTHDNPDKEFTLIMGGDNWSNLPRWKNYERLQHEFKMLIYPRLGHEVHIPEELRENVRLVEAPIVEISSTFIRNSLKEGKNVRAFVPPHVYDFIETNALYRF
jgi:nicotinate-nucleotide adenylyltransferase